MRRRGTFGQLVYHKSCLTEPLPFQLVHMHLTRSYLGRLAYTRFELVAVGTSAARRSDQRGSTLNAVTPTGRSRLGRQSLCPRFTRKWLLACTIRYRFRLYRQQRAEDRERRTRKIGRLNCGTSNSPLRNKRSGNKPPQRQVRRRQGK